MRIQMFYLSIFSLTHWMHKALVMDHMDKDIHKAMVHRRINFLSILVQPVTKKKTKNKRMLITNTCTVVKINFGENFSSDWSGHTQKKETHNMLIKIILLLYYSNLYNCWSGANTYNIQLKGLDLIFYHIQKRHWI